MKRIVSLKKIFFIYFHNTLNIKFQYKNESIDFITIYNSLHLPNANYILIIKTIVIIINDFNYSINKSNNKVIKLSINNK